MPDGYNIRFQTSGKTNTTLVILVALIPIVVMSCIQDVPSKSGHIIRNHGGNKKIASHNVKKYHLNLFIENSLSMGGYVNGVTSFQQAIQAVVYDMQLSGLVDRVDLYYLNDKPVVGKLNANRSDLSKLLTQLNPIMLTHHGVNHTSSDISANLDRTLSYLDSNSVTIFVSDCIFSPGSKTAANMYLKNQETGLKASFKTKLDTIPFATQILRFMGEFNGTYYDLDNQRVNLSKKKRPYFMIVSGPPAFLAATLSAKNLAPYSNFGFTDQISFFPPGSGGDTGQTPAKLIMKYRSGTFSIQAPASDLVLAEASMPESGPFRFALAANLNSKHLGSKDLNQITQWQLTPGFRLEKIRPVSDTSEHSLRGLSHIFIFSTPKLENGEEVSFSLLNRLPVWVDSLSSKDDRNINSKQEIEKTFGLDYLARGIFNAYDLKYQQSALFKSKVRIYTSGGPGEDGRGFSWIMLVIPALLIIFIVIVKNKK